MANGNVAAAVGRGDADGGDADEGVDASGEEKPAEGPAEAPADGSSGCGDGVGPRFASATTRTSTMTLAVAMVTTWGRVNGMRTSSA